MMKLLALSLAVLGIVTGIFFALGPWIFGTPTGAASTFVAPSVVGAALCAVHWLTLKRIRSGSGKRVGLLTWNALVLAFMALGIVVAHQYGIGGRYADMIFVLFILFYLVPLTSNVIFLAVNGSAASRAG